MVPALPLHLLTQVLAQKTVGAVITFSDGTQETSTRWRRNALRHSYGSYRLPVVRNVSKLALEMDNSPRMVFQHDREVVTPSCDTALTSSAVYNL